MRLKVKDHQEVVEWMEKWKERDFLEDICRYMYLYMVYIQREREGNREREIGIS